MTIGNMYHRAKTLLWYKPRFKAIGSGCVIRNPLLFTNPSYIEIGDHVSIRDGCRLEVIFSGVTALPVLKIGTNCHIEQHVHIVATSRVELGMGCVVSGDVYISDTAHGLNPNMGLIMKQKLESKGPVLIGSNTFIGYGVSIMPGVTLGERCVVGTRSVVTKSFPSYSMVAGNPARIIKQFNQESGKWLKYLDLC